MQLLGVSELLIDELREHRQHLDRLIDPLLLVLRGGIPVGGLGVDRAREIVERLLELFAASTDAGELALGLLVGGRGVAPKPVKRVARDRHVVEREQAEQLCCVLPAHPRLRSHEVNGAVGRASGQRGLVAVAAHSVPRERAARVAGLLTLRLVGSDRVARAGSVLVVDVDDLGGLNIIALDN